jgi:hypothetical protein
MILEIIKQTLSETSPEEVVAPKIGQDDNGASRATFQTSLAAHLFGWPKTSALRVCLALTAFVKVRAPSYNLMLIIKDI